MNRHLKRGVRWLVSAAILVLLVVFARTINWHSAWDSMSHASLPLLAAAIAINFLSVVIKGVRWWLFLRPAGIRSLPLALRATTAGAGLNNVLVAQGGDAARVVFVSRASGVSSATVLASLALEKMFDPIGFVMLLVGGILLFDLPPQFDRWRVPAEILLGVIVLLLVFFVYATRNAKPEHVPERRVRARTIIGRLKAYLGSFARTARLLASGPRFTMAIVLSLLSWAAQLATFALSAAAAHVTLPVAGSLACLLAINVGLILRATPGNVGFFQFAYALMAEQFGVSRNDAIAVSLLIQTIQIIPMTALGIALAPQFIFKRARNHPEDDAVAAEVKAVEAKLTEGPPPQIPLEEQAAILRAPRR